MMSDTLIPAQKITARQKMTAKIHDDKFCDDFAENILIPPPQAA